MPSLSSQEATLLLTISEKLSGSLSQQEFRLSAGADLLRLLNADFLASYIWNQAREIFEQGVSINMDARNLATYDNYFQFRDPITPALQKRRSATLVCQVMPQKDLERTEFFNDFLAQDGLHHGINLYAYDGDLNIGDLRIWRKKHRPDFGMREVLLLDLLKPHFRNALRNAKIHRTAREKADPLGNYWEHSPTACLVFDRDNNLIHQNQACAELEKDLSHQQYSQLVRHASLASGGATPQDIWGSFCLSVFRQEPDTDGKAHTIVHVQRATPPKLDSWWLRSHFGLSKRESEIAMLLTKGLTDNEVAKILGIKFHTVRTHLKSIFHKMEVTNRTELLHVMMNSLLDIVLD